MKIYEKLDYTLNIQNPATVRTEMKKLLSEISQLEARINVRDLVVEALYKNEEKRPEDLIEELHTLLDDTERALHELKQLKDTLSILGEELLEYRTVVL